MELLHKLKRPRGVIRMNVSRHGKLLWKAEFENLFVNAGLPALAALLAGDTAGEFAAAIGFGSGTAAPLVTDTGLTAPVYYKALASHSEDGSGDVTLNWTLASSGGTGDTGAIGITITELGLFGNTGSVSLPGTTAPAPLLARRTIAPIAFASGMNITGSWTFTF